MSPTARMSEGVIFWSKNTGSGCAWPKGSSALRSLTSSSVISVGVSVASMVSGARGGVVLLLRECAQMVWNSWAKGSQCSRGRVAPPAAV